MILGLKLVASLCFTLSLARAASLQEEARSEVSASSDREKRHLTEDFVRKNDVCRNLIGHIVKCNKAKFPDCKPGIETCLDRVPLNSIRYYDKWKNLEDEKYFKNKRYYDDDKQHVIFVIDYRKVHCAPRIGWNCDRCDNPAIFCRKAGHCMRKREWKKSCTDKSNSNASRIKSRLRRERVAARKKSRAKRKEERIYRRKVERRRQREEEKKLEEEARKQQELYTIEDEESEDSDFHLGD